MPLKTVSELNCSEHWSIKAKRHRSQQKVVRLFYARYASSMAPPCSVRLTRLATRLLDDDNLVGALKWIRDEISECLIPDNRTFLDKKGKVRKVKGRRDCDPRISWSYDQRRHPCLAIEVTITPTF